MHRFAAAFAAIALVAVGMVGAAAPASATTPASTW